MTVLKNYRVNNFGGEMRGLDYLMKYSGFTAQIIRHEMDHFEGILI